MNIDRLEYIAKWLEAGAPEEVGFGFDINHGIQVADHCSTTCCIAGAATQFFGDETGPALLEQAKQEGLADWNEYESGLSVFKTAQELLGLSWTQAVQLFEMFPDFPDAPITPQLAAAVVRRLIKTGEVNWSVKP
jgi:hypothetical protein